MRGYNKRNTREECKMMIMNGNKEKEVKAH
jgi:hypothetical protein